MSYKERSVEAIQKISAQERDAVVAVKQMLDAAGIVCTQFGVGSTPTCSHPPPDGLGDVTEMHPGNYIFYGRCAGACWWGWASGTPLGQILWAQMPWALGPGTSP